MKLSWLHLWQPVFVIKFDDILPSVARIGENLMLVDMNMCVMFVHIYAYISWMNGKKKGQKPCWLKLIN